jgi:DNA-3-methyladenine glycosylase
LATREQGELIVGLRLALGFDVIYLIFINLFVLSDMKRPNKILAPSFFNRDARAVAKDLLGKCLVRKQDGGNKAYIITETEAYIGPQDKASHAYRGRTARTEIMFGPPGTLYVYFVYGAHHILNVVTGKKNFPAAVLLRGVDGISGPGRLTKALGITKKQNGLLALPGKSPVWFEDSGQIKAKIKIVRAPRVGVPYAKEWKNKPYRFSSLNANKPSRDS